MGWEKLRSLFKGKSVEKPSGIPIAAEVQPEPKAVSCEDSTSVQHIDDLLQAISMAQKDGADPYDVIARLQAVLDSPNSLPETKAFCLVAIGEQYLGTEKPEDALKAWDVFSELIDSNSPAESWRVMARIRRGILDSYSVDRTVLERGRKDLTLALGSREVSEFEPDIVASAYLRRAQIAEVLDDTVGMLADYQHVVDGLAYSTEFRVGALREKANWLATDGRWDDAFQVCFEVIDRTDDQTLSKSAEFLFAYCLKELGQRDWDLVIVILNTLEKSAQTDGQLRLIQLSRIRAYDSRRADGDELRRAAEVDSLYARGGLESQGWISSVLRRAGTIVQQDYCEDEVISDLLKIVIHPGVSPDERALADFFIGRLYINQRDEASLNDAVHHLSRALASSHLHEMVRKDALLSRSDILMASGLFDEAIEDLSEIVKLERGIRSSLSALAHDRRADAYAHLGTPEDRILAVQDLNALLAYPEVKGDAKADIHFRKGTLFKYNETWEEAIEEFSQAIVFAEQSLGLRASALIERSTTLWLSKMDSGLDDLNSVIGNPEIGPKWRHFAIFERAQRYVNLGMMDEARADVDLLLSSPEVEPALRSNAVYVRAKIACESGETESANRDLEAAMADPEIFPEYGLHCHFLLAEILFARREPGDWDRAKKECVKVMQSEIAPQWLLDSAAQLLDRIG